MHVGDVRGPNSCALNTQILCVVSLSTYLFIHLYKNFQIPLKVSIDSYEQIKFKHCHKHGNNNKLFLEAEQRLNWFEFIK